MIWTVSHWARIIRNVKHHKWYFVNVRMEQQAAQYPDSGPCKSTDRRQETDRSNGFVAGQEIVFSSLLINLNVFIILVHIYYKLTHPPLTYPHRILIIATVSMEWYNQEDSMQWLKYNICLFFLTLENIF